MKKVFAERLSTIMAGRNPRKMAEITGLSPQAIHRYLAGERTPTGDAIVSICESTGVSADYLLGIHTPADSPPPTLAERPIPYNAGHEPCPNCAAKDLTIAHLAATLEHLTKAKK